MRTPSWGGGMYKAKSLPENKYPPKIRDLMRLCKDIYNDREMRKFLWECTLSEEQYQYIMDALRKLANLKLYEWLEVE